MHGIVYWSARFICSVLKRMIWPARSFQAPIIHRHTGRQIVVDCCHAWHFNSHQIELDWPPWQFPSKVLRGYISKRESCMVRYLLASWKPICMSADRFIIDLPKFSRMNIHCSSSYLQHVSFVPMRWEFRGIRLIYLSCTVQLVLSWYMYMVCRV